MIKTIWPDLTEEDLAMWKDVGLTFKMIRRYQKFVLLYYVPRFSHLFALLTFKYFDIYISSLFCVVSSWGSFLISPQVLQNIKTFQDVSNLCLFSQIVPGRMGLLVTLFLSLTALLVSTITSSPEVLNYLLLNNTHKQ